jgi:F-type H+-transporting ATPase subunit delta
MATQDILAIRYSEAVFLAASEKKLLDKVEADFTQLAGIVSANKNIRNLLISKVVPKRIKAKFWDGIVFDNTFNDLTINFLKVLTKNNRLDALPKIIDNYHSKLRESRGVLTAHITTAKSLDKSEIIKIANDLKVVFGKEIEVKAKVREKIIGGVIVRVGSKMIDCSLSSKISKIKQLMQSVRI